MRKKQKIFLCSEDLFFIKKCKEALGEEFSLVHFSTPFQSLLESVRKTKPHLVILDDEELLDILCKEPQAPVCLFASSQMNLSQGQRAIKTGAQDVFFKTLSEEELLIKVYAQGKIKNTLQSLHEKNKRLEHLAQRDELTGLYNFRFFYESLEMSLAKAKRYEEPLALMMLDIDNFKTINDSYGHEAGNDILKEFSKVLKEQTRKSDIVARYGGDEFVVLLYQITEEEAQKVFSKCMESIESHLFLIKEKPLQLELSVGMVFSRGLEKAKTLLKKADAKMYFSKNHKKKVLVA